MRQSFSEAPTRIELVIRVLQTLALPLGYVASNYEQNTFSFFEVAILRVSAMLSATSYYTKY